VAEANRVPVEIDGRELSLSNLDKVLYPSVGFTKGQVVDYYARVAPVMLPHLRNRAVTFRRFPNGVDGTSFFEKRCPGHRPEWVATAVGPGDREGVIDYCVIDDLPSLVWAANLAVLELHAPMARADDLNRPTMVVFDLDPGAPATIVECCQVGLEVRDLLDDLGLRSFAKTSGSKGLQVYVPLNTPRVEEGLHDHEHASSFALAVGQLLERGHPSGITTTMAKEARPGKVFVDWSQNSFHKTTVCVYSLRARPEPTVSTPVTWAEVEACAGGGELSFDAPAVLDRVEQLGDLFAEVETLEQQLPAPRS
jgi:bifunctional non-homologous end joining protein LigD